MVFDVRETAGAQDVIIAFAGRPVEVRPTPLVVDHGIIFNEIRRPRRFAGLHQIIGEHLGRVRRRRRRPAERFRRVRHSRNSTGTKREHNQS